jgi:hypothetical protein
MTQQLISALFDRWNGQPILVIGGGKSVSLDLPKLGITPACVISANDHGAHQSFFKVDLYVNVDKIHCMKKVPMQQIMCGLGAPVVNKHSWADYRLPDWHFTGNTGLTSVAVAAALGGNPVLVTGLDFWHEGRVYFHESEKIAAPRRNRFVRASVTRRDREAMRPLKVFTAGANIRPLSGPMCEVFPKYDPDQVLPLPRPIAYRTKLLTAKAVPAKVIRDFPFSTHDMARAGTTVYLTPDEMVRWAGKVVPI